jgi:hypothetical protein
MKSLREEWATIAFQELVAATAGERFYESAWDHIAPRLAKRAWLLADAMIAAREEETP